MDLPQLRMGHRRLASVTLRPVTGGIEIRTIRDGDEQAWRVLLADGQFAFAQDPMNATDLDFPDGVLFAVDQHGLLLASASLFRHDDVEPDAVVEIGWVVTRPEARRRGFAAALVSRLLQRADALGYPYAFLTTHESRDAAIRCYLALGFEPELVAPGQAAFWSSYRVV